MDRETELVGEIVFGNSPQEAVEGRNWEQQKRHGTDSLVDPCGDSWSTFSQHSEASDRF